MFFEGVALLVRFKMQITSVEFFELSDKSFLIVERNDLVIFSANDVDCSILEVADRINLTICIELSDCIDRLIAPVRCWPLLWISYVTEPCHKCATLTDSCAFDRI